MTMHLTAEMVETVISSMMRRCDAARSAGGIALRDAVDGTPVPDGWKLDFYTDYYLPPNVVLL